MKRNCPECGEIITGRTDKKFCNDYCRNTYNNKQNSSTNNYVRSINTILRKNRKILQTLLPPKGKGIVKSEKILSQGFNFNFHTHTYVTKKGDTYYFCYEYGYLALKDKGQYLLVNNTADLNL